MKNKNKTAFIFFLILVALGIGLLAYPSFRNGPTNLGSFASCLKDKGVLFYGAFWCPHCQKQKTIFGNAADQLPYVECSTPDGQGQTQVCIDKNIHGYPTWIFPDKTQLTGEISLQTLADKSSCALPTK